MRANVEEMVSITDLDYVRYSASDYVPEGQIWYFSMQGVHLVHPDNEADFLEVVTARGVVAIRQDYFDRRGPADMSVLTSWLSAKTNC